MRADAIRPFYMHRHGARAFTLPFTALSFERALSPLQSG
jgi:hypothetical protein